MVLIASNIVWTLTHDAYFLNIAWRFTQEAYYKHQQVCVCVSEVLWVPTSSEARLDSCTVVYKQDYLFKLRV